MYKVADDKLVVVYGFRTAFGGGKSTGFALIYDNIKAMQQFDAKYRLVRAGMAKRIESTRKQRKERKNRANRAHGVDKAIIRSGGAIQKKEKE
jgi:small subunit ribosomal protein S24e